MAPFCIDIRLVMLDERVQCQGVPESHFVYQTHNPIGNKLRFVKALSIDTLSNFISECTRSHALVDAPDLLYNTVEDRGTYDLGDDPPPQQFKEAVIGSLCSAMELEVRFVS